MDKLRSIIREELKVIINSDKPSEQVDFGPALERAIRTLIDIQQALKSGQNDTEKIKAINRIADEFF